jgi:phospholipid-binding lipoprotein MlaA
MMRWRGTACAAALRGGRLRTTRHDPRDPLEGFNRAMYSFNDGFDTAIGKPVATAYRDIHPARCALGPQFLRQHRDLWIGVNNLLQGKPPTRSPTGRVSRSIRPSASSA